MQEKKPYLYETHLHTYPVSKCARAAVRETLEAYIAFGYDGVFITNHFLDGNINIDRSLPYEERIHFYFSDYEEAVCIGKELGIRVFCGVEMSYGGTDFLVYGLDKEWFLTHPEIENMKYSARLSYLCEAGALIIQAHPFREAAYIDHIRLFPRNVYGVETYNACRTPFENNMAELYAEHYGLPEFSGSDNHHGGKQKFLGGMQSETPIKDEWDFISRYKNGELCLIRKEIQE
ncbi:MAG: histidinol phosphatase [Ruminococcaceae bacterium]|nr:histidinol phosphatase [Oscillospiraceae bacterium]